MQGQTKKYSFCFAFWVFRQKKKEDFLRLAKRTLGQLWPPTCIFAIMFGVFGNDTLFKYWHFADTQHYLCLDFNGNEPKFKRSSLFTFSNNSKLKQWDPKKLSFKFLK